MVGALDDHLPRADDLADEEVGDATHVRRIVLRLEDQGRHVDLLEAMCRRRVQPLLAALVHQDLVQVVERDLADPGAGLVRRPERRPDLEAELLRPLQIAGLDRGLDRPLALGPPFLFLFGGLEATEAGRHRHQRPDLLRMHERVVQRDPAAHRAPDQGGVDHFVGLEEHLEVAHV